MDGELCLFSRVSASLKLFLSESQLKKKKEKIENQMSTALKRFSLLYQEPLRPFTNHSLKLQNQEICYSRNVATMYGYKTVEGTMAYHGPIVRIPIAKGISYRAAILSGADKTQQKIVPLAVGEVFLTNKRVIFRGDKKNNSVYLNKILELTYFYGDDSIRINKDNGPPFFLGGLNGEHFWYLYCRVDKGLFEAVDVTPDQLIELVPNYQMVG